MQRVQRLVERIVHWLLRPRSALVRYAVAVAIAGSAGALTISIPSLAARPVFTGFATAVAIATLFGGLGPGLLALATSSVLAALAVLRADGTDATAGGAATIAAFAVFGLLILLLAHLMRAYAAQAQRREDQLGRSLAVVKGWAWEYDYATGRVDRIADGHSRLSLLNRTMAATRDAWREAMLPEDRARVQSTYEAALASGADEYRTEYRIRLAGDVYWVEDVVRIERDEDGRPRRAVGFALDITDRKRITDQLAASERRAREMAEALLAADRRKDEFLAMLAHELRNPLAPIRTATTLLERLVPADDARVRTPVAILARQVSHLARIVDDLLDVSRITHGRIELQPEPVALDEIVGAACEAAQPLIQQRRHELVVENGGAWVRGDRARLVQIATNLLTNAAKYTPDGGHVAIRAWRDGGDACLRVTDDGKGIAPELLPHVFDLFVQGEQTIDRAQGGLGLGLSLVKRLVEMHGGSVVAQSDGAGRGATFVVRLPAIERPAAASAA